MTNAATSQIGSARDDVRDELVELEPRQRDREEQQDEDRDDDRQLRAPVAQSLRRWGSAPPVSSSWTSGSSTTASPPRSGA